MNTILPIKRKITVMGENWGWFEIEDCTDHYNMILSSEGKESADTYFQPGIYTSQEIDALNGKHFLFGFIEALGQSENCPPQLFALTEPLAYHVETINDNLVISHNAKSAEVVMSVIQMLQNTQLTSRKYLESLDEDIVQHPKVTDLFQHYWISNLKLESIAQLLEVSQK
ncbi:hypothetical protein ACFVS2_20885 [Brevibacillus sp. NPDC058079]|uniref:hypothetical protein n=1 Tax=Brevibacillus sp. NPDC058079 TaxID=3346330 RepID=UPI0036E74574